MLTQNKNRLFEKEKIEYTLRTIRSLLYSAKTNTQLKNLKISFKILFLHIEESIEMFFKNIFSTLSKMMLNNQKCLFLFDFWKVEFIS